MCVRRDLSRKKGGGGEHKVLMRYSKATFWSEIRPQSKICYSFMVPGMVAPGEREGKIIIYLDTFC